MPDPPPLRLHDPGQAAAIGILAAGRPAGPASFLPAAGERKDLWLQPLAGPPAAISQYALGRG